MFGNSISRTIVIGCFLNGIIAICSPVEGAPLVQQRGLRSPESADGFTGPDSDCADALLGDCPHGPIDLRDDQIDAFARKLDPGGDELAARFIAALSTATGRLALAGCVVEWSATRRTRLGQEALRHFFSVHFAEKNGLFELRESSSWLRKQLREHTDRYESEMTVLLPAIRTIAARMIPDGVTGRHLRELLDHDVAPSVVYESLVRPLSRPDPLRRVLGKLFTIDDAGFLTIPTSKKKRAGLVLDQFLNGAEAFEELKRRLAVLGRDVAEIDLLHVRLHRALEDPLFAAHLAHNTSKRLKDSRASSPKKLMNQVVADTEATLERTPTGHRIRSSGLATIEGQLDHYDEMRSSYRSAQKRIDRFALGMTKQDGLRERWLRVLGAELVAVWVADTDLSQPADVLDILRNTTFLGTALIEDGSRYRINPRLTSLVQVRLARLRSSFDERAQVVGDLDPLTQRVQDGVLRRMLQSPAGQFFMLEWVRESVADQEESALRHWGLERFESMSRVRASVSSEIESIIDESTAERQVLEIDLQRLEFDDSHMDILRSSSFYNPRTAFDVHTYQTEFEDHYAARVFGVFSLQARESTSLEDFRTRLHAQRGWLTELARSHDRMVINISDSPRWLSPVRTAPNDPATFFHPPADYSIWQEMVKDLVVLMRECYKGLIYYEFWSEPDGRFLGTMDDFLSLYAVTAKTIKEADPAAMVGGSAVNRWDGTLSADRSRGAINMALIRYARKKRLPLDFISWHHFATDLGELGRAKQAYEASFRENRFEPWPESYLSEWNIPLNLRGSRYAAATAADYFVRFHEIGLAMQTVAAWVDFNPKPALHDYSPYGLLTQQGYKRPEFFTHKLFDRITRDSQGISVIKSPAMSATVVVSKKGRREYDILMWTEDYRSPMQAATAFLHTEGLTGDDLQAYGGQGQLMEAILHVKPHHRRWTSAFAAARDLFLGHSESPTVVQLRFPGWNQVHVRSAQAVTTSLTRKPVFAAGHTIALDLRPFELCRVQILLD